PDVAQLVGGRADLLARAHDRRAAVGLDPQHVHALAAGDAGTGALAHGERADAAVLGDDGAVEALDRSRDERLRRPAPHEVAVIAADEAEVLAVGLVRRREAEAHRDGARLGLAGELADRQLEARELPLA